MNLLYLCGLDCWLAELWGGVRRPFNSLYLGYIKTGRCKTFFYLNENSWYWCITSVTGFIALKFSLLTPVIIKLKSNFLQDK